MSEVDVADGGVRLRLAAEEADVLRRLARELGSLLRGDRDRDDGVIARLLPDAYEQPDDVAAFRDMTEDALVADKLAAADAVASVLGPRGPFARVLQPDEAESWMRTITDMRLAIGARLDVDEELMARPLDPRDPQAAALSIVHWLGWMTEEIIGALRALG